jgi:hypothetical protein
MDLLDELAAFVAIVDADSFAEDGRLRRSPPAVTRSLAPPKLAAGWLITLAAAFC